ncbi:MAG TPA: ceramide glucosyltransferase [Beijerinckiaceae bacterium]|nr:ceramide glucosyltransferase [Beijerinckiaceae bacterium]
MASIGLWTAAAFLAIQIGTCAVAGWRCRRRSARPAPPNAPPISLVRPLCGVESHTQQTLEACFHLDYPRFELLFCVASAADPVASLVEKVIRSFPQVNARLLVGEDPISANPKLNNMVKAWREAQFDHIVFADSNLLAPPDYLSRLASTWRKGVGLVSAPPIGSDVDGFWSELEAAFLNTYEARWQYLVDAAGFGFAQGKTLFYRRSILKGGIEALASEPAEDAASTKIVRASGLSVKLVAPPFFQPLGKRTLGEVWSRQIRWARLRRATFPFLFLPEVATGLALPLLVAAFAASAAPWPAAPALLAYVALWYLAEISMCLACGWELSPTTVFALIARDLLIPALWVKALSGRSFVWKGQSLEASPESDETAQPARLVRRLARSRKTSHSEAALSARSSHALEAVSRKRGATRARMIAAVRKISRAQDRSWY